MQTTSQTQMSKAAFGLLQLKTVMKVIKSELKNFIGKDQLFLINKMIAEGEDQTEALFFVDKLSELAGIVTSMPITYETDGMGDEAVVHLHYFTAGSDFYITERDCEEQQLQAFGMADLGDGGELGYISLVEILAAGAELDLHWTPKSLSEIKTAKTLEDVNYVGHPMHY